MVCDKVDENLPPTQRKETEHICKLKLRINKNFYIIEIFG